MNWYVEVLKKYAVFEGRARRTEYWMYMLFNIIIALVLFGLTLALPPIVFLHWLYSLAMLVPSLAVTVRRLHDTNKSGWFILLGLVPIVGPIILIVFCVLEGTKGPNQYGEDPKGEAPPPVPAA